MRRTFAGVTAVESVDLAIEPGEMFAFLGPNGAGKTTTIKMLCTLLRPDNGSAQINGHDVVAESAEVRASIGIVFQEYTLDDYLTAERNLAYHCMIYHVPRRERRARVARALDLVGLTDRADEPVRGFSGGMKRRLEVARALLHRPQVLFLDEPTVGLDPQTRRYLWEHLHALRRDAGVTLFLHHALHDRGRERRPGGHHRSRPHRHGGFAGRGDRRDGRRDARGRVRVADRQRSAPRGGQRPRAVGQRAAGQGADVSATVERAPLNTGGRVVDLDGIAMVWQRDVTRFVGQRTRIVSGAVRSIVWLVVLGLGLRRSFVPIHGLTYEQFLFPGIIAMAVIFSAIQSAISIIWDREFGFLREVLVAPVPRSSIVIGKALGGATTTTMQALIVLCLAPIAGVSISVTDVLAVVPLIFLAALAFVSLGIVIAARMRDFEGFGTIQNFVVMPLYLLSGAMFPLARTSGDLRDVVDADPLSYGVDALRQTLTGYRVHALTIDVAVLALFTVALLAISVNLFNREG